jgi:hypothetical protein
MGIILKIRKENNRRKQRNKIIIERNTWFIPAVLKVLPAKLKDDSIQVVKVEEQDKGRKRAVKLRIQGIINSLAVDLYVPHNQDKDEEIGKCRNQKITNH